VDSRRSRLPSQSLPWLPRCSLVSAVSARCRLKFGAWMQPVKRPGWRREAMMSPRGRRRAGSVPRVGGWRSGKTVLSLSRGSADGRDFFRGCSFRQRPGLLRSLVREEGGLATVLAALLIGALVVVTLFGTHIGAAVLARHRAQSAADLAVLAAANWLPLGRETACHIAVRVSQAMGAVVRDCNIDGLDVAVSVSVALGGWIGSEARASARAGPDHRP
jgi:secretion/DNA translocation related TadE-like protein